MCGLVGIFSSNMQNKHKDVLAALLYLDTWRGKDSTGVAAIRHNADTDVLKSTVPGYEFVEGPKLGEHLKLTDFCWLGHNRFGTVGRNIKTNAHPFTIDDEDGGCMIVGAHNGTLKNKYNLTDHAKFGTDSEALFNEIATIGVEKAIAKVEGAWALTYYDHIEEELRIIRNKERTLFYAWEKGKKSLIWASEAWMIRICCSKYDVELEDDKVYTFIEDTLYKFPAPGKYSEELTCERKGGLVGKAPGFFQPGEREAWRTGGNSGSQTPTSRQQTADKKETKQTSLVSLPGLPEKKTSPLTGDYSRGATTSQAESEAKSTGSSSQSGTTTQKDGEKLQKKSDSSSNTPLPSGKPDNRGVIRDILSGKKFKGFQGVLLSAQEIDKELENGCAWCEQEFITRDEKFAWLAKGKPVCYKCLIGEEAEIIPIPDKKKKRVVH